MTSAVLTWPYGRRSVNQRGSFSEILAPATSPGILTPAKTAEWVAPCISNTCAIFRHSVVKSLVL